MALTSIDPLLAPWFDRLRRDLPQLDLLDVHTHLGRNDPDGFSQTPAELLERLLAAGARAAVFPMHEPAGYLEANDAVLEAATHANGRLVAFCRVDPTTGTKRTLAEATRALDAGARGIKLHPRAEGFEMHAPAVRGLAGLAGERGVPIIIHAGRGIPALGRDTLALAREFGDARFILAHAGISDLAWIWRELPAHPNVLLDMAWWSPADLITVFAYVPPGQVLFASDAPYGTTVQAALLVLRCALQAGLDGEQILEVAGGQARRLLAGEPPRNLGPAPGADPSRLFVDPLLERIGVNLISAIARMIPGGVAAGAEPLALTRLACAVGADSPHAELCSQVLELLDRFDAYVEVPAPGRGQLSELGLITTALTLTRTPAVGLPEIGDEPVPERAGVGA